MPPVSTRVDPATLLRQLLEVRGEVYAEGCSLFEKWEPTVSRAEFLKSAQNLAFYTSLRKRDLRDIQESLSQWGLSSLGRLEGNVMSNIDAVAAALGSIAGIDVSESPGLLDRDAELLERNTDHIFGEKPSGRTARIMVTLPTEAADNAKFVTDLVSRGMDVARINCAHDNADAWASMIKNIRRAERETGRSCRVSMDIAGPKARIESMFTTLTDPSVDVGDAFFITGKDELRSFDGVGIAVKCSLPEVLPFLHVGDPVLVDNGVLECEVEKVTSDGVLVRVNRIAVDKRIRIRAVKGLNFPKSNVGIAIVTQQDRQDLDFVCENADVVGCSFVRDSEDIELIQDEISRRIGEERARKLPIMAKIETEQGFQNLPEIIVKAAGRNPFCLMIARGDLAVEVGYLRLAELQEEIQWIGEAADIPVVWATEVLNNMVRSGIPTRAEVTDAFAGARTECVMLNKGKFLAESVDFLNSIIVSAEGHQRKKTARLRALELVRRSEFLST